MTKQATQKEVINYIREDDFMDTILTGKERELIKNLHRKDKQFLNNPKEVIQAAEEFKEYTITECSSGTYDYYADVIKFLLEDRNLSIIWGYQNYKLNTPTLFRWLQKILEVKECRVNY